MNDNIVNDTFAKQLLAVVGVFIAVGIAVIGYVANIETDAVDQRRQMRDAQHRSNVIIAEVAQEVQSAIGWGKERLQNRDDRLEKMEDRIDRLEQKEGEPCED